LTDDYGSYSGSCAAPDFELDPDATDDYTFALAPELDGDTIDTVTFLLPDGLTEVSSSNTDTTATIFLTGAECGVTYRVTCHYTTTGGRTRDKTIRVVGRSQ
jgi:hypothetical protein